MDEEWRSLAFGVRLDRRGFAAEVEAMRAGLEGPLAQSAERAGRSVEGALLRAARSGRLGFEDLKKTALNTMDAIAASALKAGIAAIGGDRGGGLAGVLGAVVAGGLPGRATGGPVSPARPYLVGERGPEVFVPTAAGRVEAAAPSPREVRVAITVQGPADAAPALLQRSSRQVARAVRAALSEQV